VQIRWHICLQERSVHDQLHRVDEHPGRQQSTTEANENRQKHESSICSSSDNLLDLFDLIGLRGCHLSLDFPVQLSSKFHLNALVALEKLNIPKRDSDVIF